MNEKITTNKSSLPNIVYYAEMDGKIFFGSYILTEQWGYGRVLTVSVEINVDI